MIYLKFLDAQGCACNGGHGQWYLPKGKRPGKWMPRIGQVVPCESGYHLVKPAGVLGWLAPTLYVAEGRGEHIAKEANVEVFAQARLLRKIDSWNECTARLLACDYAERVLPIFETIAPNDNRPRQTIAVARKFANGEATTEELAAAWNAAMSAAGSAANAAERAAWSAANAANAAVSAANAAERAASAARAAAWSVASAAGSAANAAKRAANAAGAAECRWQVCHFWTLIEPEMLKELSE